MSISSFVSSSRSRYGRPDGFTLTEMAIVLGVVGVIIAGIWSVAGIVNERSRLSNAQNEFNIIAQGMTALLQGGYGVSVAPCGPTPCDITAPMITAQTIPQPYGNPATGTASNPWNISGFNLIWVNVAPTKYRMSFYQVNQASCPGFIMAMTACTPGKPGCPVTVGTAGTPPPAYAAPTPAHSFATTGGIMTTAEAQILCGFNGAANSVEFDFAQ